MASGKPELHCLLLAAVLFSSPIFSAEKPINWNGLPPPYDTPSAVNPPRVVPRPAGAELKLPLGFRIREYGGDLPGARYMVLGPRQEVLVSSLEEGKVFVIQDRWPKTLISGLYEPYGMVLHEGWLYVAEPTSVKRYRYDPQALAVSERQEVIALSGLEGGHATRTLLVDDSGEKLYVSIGSASNVDLGEPPMRAAINRFNIDGTGQEIFASGIRNAVGLRWYPGSDALWATSHERDKLGDDLVPDFLTSVKRGDFFGWPYAYIGPHEDPRHAGKAPAKVKQTRYPEVLLGSHVGAMDLLFYTGAQFPPHYRGGCFVALHGSWNRSRRVGYKLVFVPFKSGKPTSGPEDFLTGWMVSPDRREVWGRPVGLLELADGSLLVSDDGAGKIWRVEYSP
ncbi:MAG: PQQ-dependent sugar dehydrogenase [Gammaproteobacteria bacterium]